MNEAEVLSKLKQAAESASLHSKRVDKVLYRKGPPAGVFLPPAGTQGETHILLRSGRPVDATLLTLCHELGHFWSYATGRRTQEYEKALLHLNRWMSSLDSKVRNHDAVMAFPSGAPIPEEVRTLALANAKREKPNPLALEQRWAVVSEEVRAWCFGAELAKVLGVPEGRVLAEAQVALGYYYELVELSPTAWSSASCIEDLLAEDRRFIEELAK